MEDCSVGTEVRQTAPGNRKLEVRLNAPVAKMVELEPGGSPPERRDGVEVLLEVSDGRSPDGAWRAESVEVLQLGSGAKSVWAVEPVPEDARVAGRVFLPTQTLEPVSRLRVEFSKVSGFEANELWQTKPVALPGPGISERPPVTGTVDGAVVSLHSLTGPKGAVPGAFREFFNGWMGDSSAFTLWVEVSPQGADRRLTLVSAVDERGRSAETRSGMWSGEQYAFGLIPPPGASQLIFTFALHSSRVVELMVDTRVTARGSTSE